MVITMNNKGQTLAIFVIILPIILLVLLLIIDFGLLSIEKRKISSDIKTSIKYGLNNNSNSNDIQELLYKNIDQNKIKKLDINITDNSVSIDIIVKYDSIFKIINNEIKLSYIGIKENNKIEIKKR